jgi:mono/diheme cytochrome c family protein
MDYPVWDIGLSGGVLIGAVAIAHVIVAHFAIGGGLLIAVTETLSIRPGDHELRELARRSSFMLVLVSTVFGAISGVGIWVTVGLVSPRAISALIHTFVWGWAIEWVMFFVEIVAALVWVTTWGKISRSVHVMVGWIYFVAAFLSLVIINGILSFMLTPGEWLSTGAFWDGFFNPSYWPSLVLRTGIVLIMATAFMVFPAMKAAPERRPALVRYLGLWLVGGALVAYAGYRWWEAVLPETARSLFVPGQATLAGLETTRHLVLWSLAAVLLMGLILLVALPRAARPLTGVAIMVAAFLFFGSYERLREGVRKPFLIHSHMFSNGLLVDEIARLNEEGLVAGSGWVARGGTEDQEALGERIFRAQCSTCHTTDGYQAIRPLLPEDPDMMMGPLMMMYEMGEAFAAHEPGKVIDTSGLDYPYMPPFVGTFEEMEALAAYLTSIAGAPTSSGQAGGRAEAGATAEQGGDR